MDYSGANPPFGSVVIRASALDWTIVRPAVLNDKPGRGEVRALTTCMAGR
jgi:NAD(P)H-binding